MGRPLGAWTAESGEWGQWEEPWMGKRIRVPRVISSSAETPTLSSSGS